MTDVIRRQQKSTGAVCILSANHVNTRDTAKHAISPTTCQRNTRPFSSLRFECVAASSRSKSYFFRLIEFLNVVLCCWFQHQLSVRLYETEESFHGR